MEAGIIIVLILVVVGGIIWLAIYLDKKRTEKLMAEAEGLQMSFEKKDFNHNVRDLHHRFALFQGGRSRKARNIMHGNVHNMDCYLFDYQYTTGSGKHQTTHMQSVLSFTSDQFKLPAFSMRPENFFDRAANFFGSNDIDFDTHEIFSKKYYLKGENEEGIRNLFEANNDKLLNFFTDHLGWYIEANNEMLIICRQGRRKKPTEIRNYFTEGVQIMTQFIGK